MLTDFERRAPQRSIPWFVTLSCSRVFIGATVRFRADFTALFSYPRWEYLMWQMTSLSDHLLLYTCKFHFCDCAKQMTYLCLSPRMMEASRKGFWERLMSADPRSCEGRLPSLAACVTVGASGAVITYRSFEVVTEYRTFLLHLPSLEVKQSAG